jgi:3'(2'), 5'-bisphosphate nucleotidase
LHNLSEIYQTAIIASIEASKVIMKYYESGFNSEIKKDGSPVTEADLASSKIISEILLKTSIPILGEETDHQHFDERKKWTLNWCVDPLDGTKEYIKRNGEFAVNIALIENNQSIFGVIAWPEKNKLIFGGKDCGVFISKFEDINNRINWKKIDQLNLSNDPIVMITSHSPNSGASLQYLEKIKTKYSTIQYLKKGSALKFFDLAEGNADIYPRFAPTMEWDIAAGQAILEALGGSICSVNEGQPLTYNKESLFNPHFIALTFPLVQSKL